MGETRALACWRASSVAAWLKKALGATKAEANSAARLAWSSGSVTPTRAGSDRRASLSWSSRISVRITCSSTVVASTLTASQRPAESPSNRSALGASIRTTLIAARSACFFGGDAAGVGQPIRGQHVLRRDVARLEHERIRADGKGERQRQDDPDRSKQRHAPQADSLETSP